MEIKLNKAPRMTIEEFADKHDLIMEVNERSPVLWKDESSRYYAHFRNAEISRDIFLAGSFGDGSTPEEAISNYAKEISGRTLVVEACRDSRRDIRVPILIEKEEMYGIETTKRRF